jgi:hypothetical protein
MLKEIDNPRQVKDEPPRRWFSCDLMDLIVWEQPDGDILGFQLCYDKDRVECAMTWRQGMGYQHTVVDDGMRIGKHKATPLLMAPRAFDKSRVDAIFREQAANLDPVLRDLVSDKINAFPDAENHTT